jgi:hypothetical protein
MKEAGDVPSGWNAANDETARGVSRGRERATRRAGIGPDELHGRADEWTRGDAVEDRASYDCRVGGGHLRPDDCEGQQRRKFEHS